MEEVSGGATEEGSLPNDGQTTDVTSTEKNNEITIYIQQYKNLVKCPLAIFTLIRHL